MFVQEEKATVYRGVSGNRRFLTKNAAYMFVAWSAINMKQAVDGEGSVGARIDIVKVANRYARMMKNSDKRERVLVIDDISSERRESYNKIIERHRS